jgi:hypothetical protein
MTVGERFAALIREQPVGLAAPELLPVRLARAAQQLLGVDGAGISVMADPGLRVPLGASDDDAATAERLQFTMGEGPCLHAHATGRPVIAAADVFARRWPLLYEELTTHTAYRAVVSVPLRHQFTGLGALDLHLRQPENIPVDIVDHAYLVADEISAALTAPQPVPGDGSAHHSVDPPWLDSAAAQRRQLVWLAIGMVSVHLDLPAPDALAALRGLAYTRNQDVDALAADLTHRRIPLSDLQSP